MLRLASFVAISLALAACGGSTTESAGNFTLRHQRTEFGGHSATKTTLSYQSRTLAEHLSDWTVDPSNPDHIVYAARSEEAGGSLCGTFYFDGKSSSETPWKLSARVLIVHDASKDSPDRAGASPWSPDGRYIYVGNDIAQPVVFDVIERRPIEIASFLSVDGKRLELVARVWSPDSRHLAVEVAPNGYNGGRDLAVIRVLPPFIEYMASMNGPLPLWTTADYQWSGTTLLVNESGKNGPIVRKASDEIPWTFGAPSGRSVFFSPADQTCH